MKTVVVVLGVATTVLAIWGMLAPRGFWTSLLGWSFADQPGGEPGSGSYRTRRLLLGLGLAAIAILGIVVVVQALVSPQRVATPPTAVERMWGPGSHELVNRVVSPLSAAPTTLVEMPVLDYQDLDDGPADYLRTLPKIAVLGNYNIPGLIGIPPSDGYGATDTAELILHVRGPLLCIPRAAVVIETPESITVGVFYGLPDGATGPGGTSDVTVECPADAAVTSSILLPIELGDEVGERPVLNLAGEQLDPVPLIER